MTINEAHERVTRGAVLLDRVAPGWYQRVDPDRLLMSTCIHCTLGQLYGHFADGLTALHFTDTEFGESFALDADAVRHGFVLSWSELDVDNQADSYKMLQRAWIDAIEDRHNGLFPTQVVVVEQETVGV